MTPEELRKSLADSATVRAQSFEILSELCRMRSGDAQPQLVQELVLRALENREHFGQSLPVLHALVREMGLFPYLLEESQELSTADQLALEVHRPPHLDRFVFHHPQAKIFHRIMSGESVVLSAPTSFGKSLIIDAIIATKRFSNVVVVVPTLALIDETRRRLSQFKNDYAIITQGSQKPGERNVFVMTQERVLESKNLKKVDFFIIDEFYKLSPKDDHDERSALLNQAFYVLSKRCKHFYLLGPGIEDFSKSLPASLPAHFVREDYHTVVSELHPVESTKATAMSVLKSMAPGLEGSTLVFCSSPERAESVAEILPDGSAGAGTLKAAEWLAENYHPEWGLVAALRRGIGIHHGRVPRAVAQYLVKSFNDEALRFLVCTSTLIEGVNTKARNIVIFDHRINRKAIDYFTFNNIRGRSGRMFQHFVGHVYLFSEPPDDSLPFVEVPVFSQGPEATDGLLIQIDQEDLTSDAVRRLSPYHNHPLLSFGLLKGNGVDPEAQIALAEELDEDAASFSRSMAWNRVPKGWQLEVVCKLIWKHFNGRKVAANVWTARQLTKMLLRLVGRPSVRDFVESQIQYTKNKTAEEALKAVLDFYRSWATFQFPKLLRAVGRIQAAVFGARNLPTGDYDFFASRVEHLFLNPVLLMLDEYGIPLPLARKIERYLGGSEDLDEVLAVIKRLNLASMGLSEFERELIEDARKSL